ncbi:purple acid phosphatase family protein [Gloeothece citriformis]|nr:metallophosphoesterase family protein [Gloeothece citriformis]
MISNSSLLTDPFLQFPTETTVQVVWFTEFKGDKHQVVYGNNLDYSVDAVTTQLSRVREDSQSNITPTYLKTTKREIWRHEAQITGLTQGERYPYQVISIKDENGNKQATIKSDIFTLSAAPKADTSLKILLTSDHQLKPLVAANLQKVVETVGRIDGIFFAGDLVNIPDRASEWFDDNKGGAFFPCLQGRANYALTKNNLTTIYHGGELIQHAPLFPAIGNHEVMGRFSTEKTLNEQFEDAFPRLQAEKFYLETASKINPNDDLNLKNKWIKDYSFNTDTYEEIFSLPQNSPGGKQYYAVTFGDIRLIVLYVTNIWRSPRVSPDEKGKYQERKEDLNNPQNWGYGQLIFEPINQESIQYQWLTEELESEEFKKAKYKIVMFHHPPHSLGANIVPPYTDPVPKIDFDSEGKIRSMNYNYPQEQDYIIRDLIPLLESAGVQFVFYGHSHLWNRFVSPKGTHFLESSNVGNSYGAFFGNKKRFIPEGELHLNYGVTGNPNGLEPIVPNLAPLLDENNQPLPYVASNDITVFSILDTGLGTVSSYRFDSQNPQSPVIKFDEFAIEEGLTSSSINSLDSPMEKSQSSN